jgi:hypothetical protein
MTEPLVAGLVLCGGLLIVLILWHRKDAAARRRAEEAADRAWGRRPDDAPPHDAMASVASYHRNTSGTDDPGTIDDLTWADLEMDAVFRRIDATVTSPGEEVLYRWLRGPFPDDEELDQRHRLIELFRTTPDVRRRVQAILARTGKRRFVDATDYLFGIPDGSGRPLIPYALLATAALAAPAVLFVHATLGAVLVALTFACNAAVYYRRRFRIAANLDALSVFVRLVKSARRLATASIPGLDRQTAALERCVAELTDIERRSFHLTLQGTGGLGDIAGEYVRVILLKELIDYEHLRHDVVAKREVILGLYDTLGGIDAAIAVASFRDGLPWWAEPSVHRVSRAAYAEFTDLYHPLIERPVPHTRQIHQSLLVTGSNASGKSTFLKALAINALLAQSLATVCARRWTSSSLIVRTSLAVTDTVVSGESYFTAELKSVLGLMGEEFDGVPVLCVIDEVLGAPTPSSASLPPPPFWPVWPHGAGCASRPRTMARSSRSWAPDSRMSTSGRTSSGGACTSPTCSAKGRPRAGTPSG